MTIAEAIGQADHLKPNAFTEAQKKIWLSALDVRVQTDVLCVESSECVAYSGSTDRNTVLFVPAPFDMILYPLWLCAEIDIANEEFDIAANAMAKFEDEYARFACGFLNAYHPERRLAKTYERVLSVSAHTATEGVDEAKMVLPYGACLVGVILMCRETFSGVTSSVTVSCGGNTLVEREGMQNNESETVPCMITGSPSKELVLRAEGCGETGTAFLYARILFDKKRKVTDDETYYR